MPHHRRKIKLPLEHTLTLKKGKKLRSKNFVIYDDEKSPSLQSKKSPVNLTCDVYITNFIVALKLTSTAKTACWSQIKNKLNYKSCNEQWKRKNNILSNLRKLTFIFQNTKLLTLLKIIWLPKDEWFKIGQIKQIKEIKMNHLIPSSNESAR